MTKRVFLAYGGRCAFCQTTAGPFELDHVAGGGNKHRAAIAPLTLESWLSQEWKRTGEWSTLVQLLCKPCHDVKSGRKPRMPVAKGKSQVNIHLSDTVNQQLAILAGKEEFGSKSEVVEKAVLQMIQGGTDDTLLLSVHDHLSNVETRLLDAVKELTHTMQKLQTDHDNLIARLNRFEQTSQKKHDDLLKAYDSLREGLSPQPGGIKRLFGIG